jgi:3-oxoadipate enol-lactonase
VEKARINGIEIAYEVVGEGEPVLLVHGAGVSHAEFEPQYEALGATYRLIVPDVRGHVESGQTQAPYTMKQFADDMIGLLDALGIQQARVLGHSMGGTIAQQMAVDYPARVQAMVLAETTYGLKSDRMLSLLTRWSEPLIRMIGIKRLVPMTVKQLSARSPQYKALLEAMFKPHLDNPANFWNISRANNAFDGKGQLKRIQCPTLILIGEHNRATHRFGRYMVEAIPNARLMTIPGAGHMLNWDNTEAFNRAVLEFFETV